MATTTLQPQPVLTDEILIRCHERAARYDRENTFFTEDFQELRDAGYLLSPVPEEFGGRGMTLAEVVREQRRLAYYAAPTAVAINMHLCWVGMAADVRLLALALGISDRSTAPERRLAMHRRPGWPRRSAR